jgi:hypothetical protein
VLDLGHRPLFEEGGVADDQDMPVPDLSKAERALWKAFPRGGWVDVRSGDPEVDDPARAGSWGVEREVRGEVVTALLLGACKPDPGWFPALRLRGARITGRIDLMGATIAHALVLEHCWFEEQLRFVETTTKTVRIISSRLPAFNGARMRTEGILNFYQSVIEGTLRLDRARIDGEISLRGAQIGNGAAEAIAGAGLAVDGDMECNAGFTAHGRITLRRARVAGLLTFRDAVLSDSKTAADLARLEAGELCLRTAQPIAGALRLAHAHVGTLDDDPAVWPPEIWLNGFTYDTIRHLTGRVPVAERVGWVSRGPYGYQPQPYEQLADYYRRSGHDGDVRRVLLAKQRHRRTTLSTTGRIADRMLDATVGYGYRPWLAAIWLALLLTVGTTVYAIDHPHPLPGGPVPPFNPFTYSLDLLIPIGAFGLRTAYASSGSTQWLSYALIAAGWILATAVIAGVTHAVRRD